MKRDSYERGVEVYRKLNLPRGGHALPEAFREITMSNLFGDVWSRPGLAIELRSMITVATLAALGRDAQLRTHIHGALNLGLTGEQLEEIFLHIAHYAGWPTGVAANQALVEVLAELETS